MSVIFTTETIKLINLFESVTHTHVRDCLVENNTVYFLIDEGEIGKALGAGGNTKRIIESLIKKNVRVYEYSRDTLKFIRNLLPQAKDIRIRNNGDSVIAEVWIDNGMKPVVIGREGKNIKVIKEFLKRNHKINDLVVK